MQVQGRVKTKANVESMILTWTVLWLEQKKNGKFEKLHTSRVVFIRPRVIGAWRSVFDLTESALPPAPSKGLGPLFKKQKHFDKNPPYAAEHPLSS